MRLRSATGSVSGRAGARQSVLGRNLIDRRPGRIQRDRHINPPFEAESNRLLGLLLPPPVLPACPPGGLVPLALADVASRAGRRGGLSYLASGRPSWKPPLHPRCSCGSEKAGSQPIR